MLGTNKGIYKYVLDKIEDDKGLCFTVIDPADRPAEDSGKIAKLASECGVDAFAVGGSVGAQGDLLDNTIKSIKENTDKPVILFPGNIATLSRFADACYFMSLINSNDPYYISGAQIAAAMPVKKMGLEVIPTTYIVFEPGQAVGWVGSAKLIPRNIPYLPAITALAGQYLGSKLIILESGSGALQPAPPESIAATRKVTDIPILVAGGVRTPELAYQTIKAGADIIHVGTAIDNVVKDIDKARKTITSLVDAVKRAGREK